MWATFRDVANILIIGMFVFVAIATILSLPNYDTRRLVAKILIVAVLINFSMFFTKFVIDMSNFIARELYTTMPGLSTAAQSTSELINRASNTTNADGTTGVQVSANGIAGTFMDDIGITNVWNYPALSDLTTAQGPLIMLSYSLGAAAFMFIVAAVLLYGCFLLASRAILLVFLLLTSSLAFAAMLLPGKFGDAMWDKWKTSLINTAVFAPLLMLFLTATLLILTGATTVAGKGTLASFLYNPANAGGWNILFIFILASGMLLISIRVASTFASKIAGFNYAAAVPALAGSIGLGALAGAGRYGFGGLATLDKKRLERRAAYEKRSKEEGGLGLDAVSDATLHAMNRRDWLSKQSFDARNLKPVQNAFKQIGFAKTAGSIPFVSKDAVKRLTEGTKGGFAADQEALRKKAADWQSGKEKATAAAMTRNAQESVKTQNIAEFENASIDASKAAAQVVVARERAQATEAESAAKVASAEEKKANTDTRIEQLNKELEDARMKVDPARVNKVQGQIDRLITERSEIDAIINTAREESRKASEFADQAVEKAANAEKKAADAAAIAREKPKLNDDATKAIKADASAAVIRAAKTGSGQDARGQQDRMARWLYGVSDDSVAGKIREDAKKKKQKEEAKILKEVIDEGEEKKEEGEKKEEPEKKEGGEKKA
jgi:hypothetical protein